MLRMLSCCFFYFVHLLMKEVTIIGHSDVDFWQYWFWSSLYRSEFSFGFYYFYLHRRHSQIYYSKCAGCSPRQVDDTSFDERSSICHSYNYALSCGRTGYTQSGSERMSAVGARHAIGMQSFATTCASTTKSFGIERGNTTLMLTHHVERQ